MSAQEIAFVVLAGIGSLAAFRMVTTQNVVHAALYLVVTLAMVGAVLPALPERAENAPLIQVLPDVAFGGFGDRRVECGGGRERSRIQRRLECRVSHNQDHKRHAHS